MGNYVVIGGSSGIGKEITQQLAEKGHQVFSSFNKNQVESRDNIQYFHLDVMEGNMDFSSLPE